MTDQSPRHSNGTDPAKHARLLEAAAEEFARVGYERASVDTIAARAGVAKGTVYLYFEGKARLFLAVLDAVRARLAVQHPPEAVAEPVGALRTVIHDYLLLADASPDLFRCYTSALFGVNRDFQTAALDIFAWQRDRLQDLLARAGHAESPGARAEVLAGSMLAAALLRGLRGAPAADTTLEETVLLDGALGESR
jgi:AcrR family transcriptional regulator